MASAIDLRPDHRKTVEDILRDRLPDGVQVWVFGSRADWTSKDSSDLDLALEGDGPLDTGTVMALELAFEESLLPFNVDVVDLKRTEDGFRQRVLMTRTPLMSGEATVSRTGATSPGITKIPTGWSKAALSDVVDIVLSSVDKKTVDGETPVRLCNYTDVYYNQFIRKGMTFMEATATEREIGKCRLEPGDVVITKDSEKYDDIGVPSLVRDQFDDLICGYHLGILRSRPRTHGPFLFYAVSAKDVQEQFHSFANGITRFGLRKHDIGLVEVRLPSFTEQRAVAGVLAELDDRIELSRRMHATLEAMARALFKSWFVDFDPVRAKMEGRDPGLPRGISDMFPDELVDSEIGLAPVGWEVRKLGELAKTTAGRSYRSEDLVDARTALVTLKSFYRGGGYRSDGLKPYRGAYKAEQVVIPGEIIVACTDVTQAADIIGRSAVVLPSRTHTTLVASLDVLILRPSHKRMKRSFLYFLTNSARFVAYTYSYTTGTTVLHLDKRSIPEFLFPLPPMELVRRFDDHVTSLLRRVAVDSAGSDVLPAIRDALLPNLVSGRLRVPAPFLSPQAGKRTDNSLANAELPSRR